MKKKTPLSHKRKFSDEVRSCIVDQDRVLDKRTGVEESIKDTLEKAGLDAFIRAAMMRLK